MNSGCKVTPYVGKIQDHDQEFYSQFKVIISGLDNIEARRWLNSMLVNMVEKDEDGDWKLEKMIPLIDGEMGGVHVCNDVTERIFMY